LRHGVDQELADVAAQAPADVHVYSPSGITLLREMTSWPPFWKL